MTWTASSFKIRYPEFASADDALVTATLADAASYIDPALFTVDTDPGVGLKTAHLLAIANGGQMARLQKGEIATTYSAALDELIRARAGGPWIARQVPA